MNILKKKFLTSHGGLRDVPLTIERLLFSIFSLLCFLFGAYIFMPVSTILLFRGRNLSDNDKLRYHKLLQWVASFIIHHVPGVKFSFNNDINESFEKPSVIISNHQSHLDLMCILKLSPKIVILTNDRVWNNPFYRHIIRRAEFFPVSNGIEGNKKHILDCVSRGYSIMIFPEGTRSPHCDIQRFHLGAFTLAEELGLDIVPVFIHGAGHVMSKDDIILRRGSIYMEIGMRITKEDDNFGSTALERCKSIRKLYLRHFDEICKEREKASYWEPYLRYKYYYRGMRFKIKNIFTLRHYKCFSSWVDDGESYSSVMVKECVYWQFPWLYAVVHKNTEVYLLVTDFKLYKNLTSDILLPANLHIALARDNKSPFNADVEVTLSLVEDNDKHLKIVRL